MRYLVVMIFAASFAFAQSNERVGAKLTIYNQNFGVINEKLNADLTSGSQIFKVDNLPIYLNPETVRLKFAGKVLEQSFSYDFSDHFSLLLKSIGSNITVKNQISGAEYSGKLLAATDKQIALLGTDNSLISLPIDGNYNQSTYSVKLEKVPEGISMSPMLNFLISPDKSGKQKLNLSYQTDGISWQTNYFLTVSDDEKKASLDAFFYVKNSTGTDFKDADVSLIFGNVERNTDSQGAGYDAAPKSLYARALYSNEGGAEAYESRDYSDVFEYSIPQKLSLLSNEEKQIRFFSADNIKIKKKLYIYSNSYLNGKQNMPVKSVYLLENKKENGLGMLLPLGVFRVNKGNQESSIFIGDSKGIDIPINQTGEIITGDAYNIIAKEEITNIDYLEDSVVKTIEFAIENGKQDDADISLFKRIENNMQILECSHTYKIHSNGNASINVKIKKGETQKIKLKIKEIQNKNRY